MSAIIPDDPSLLRLMVTDQAQQPREYQPGRYWKGYAQRIERALERHPLSHFRDTPAIGKGYADAVVTDPSDLWDVANWKIRLLHRVAHLPLIHRHLISPYVAVGNSHAQRALLYAEEAFNCRYGARIDEMLSGLNIDTERGHPREIVTIGSHRISVTYLRHLVQGVSTARVVPFDRVGIFFELGGGFGANTHLLLERWRNIRKVVYADIVPTLYVGTQYLRSFYGSSVRDYRQTRSLDAIRFADDNSREILCVAPWQLSRVEADVDVFWNAASFSEMDPKQVRTYGREIVRLLRGDQSYVCLFNVPAEAPTGWRSSSRADVFEALAPFTIEPLVMDPPGVENEIGHVGWRNSPLT